MTLLSLTLNVVAGHDITLSSDGKDWVNMCLYIEIY